MMGMQMRAATLVILAILCAATGYGRERYTPKTEDGQYTVRTVSDTWYDKARRRSIPVKIYYPDVEARCPVIIFSHGLGGSRDGYEFLGRYWASHGFVSVHPQHPGSDASLLQRGRALEKLIALKKAASDVQNALDRPRDISFVIDRLEVVNRERGPLRAHMNLDRIGVAGHSFGAYTALVSAGRVLVDPVSRRELDLTDPRVKACLAMSAPAKTRDLTSGSYDDFSTPVFHMTGTKDDSPIGGTKAAERTIPYRAIRKANQYLVNFKGGDHQIFSGQRLRGGDGRNDPMFRLLIRVGSLAFWDQYLADDDAAGDWLQDRSGYTRWVGDHGEFESKVRRSPTTTVNTKTPAIILYRNTSRPSRRILLPKRYIQPRKHLPPRRDRFDSRRDHHRLKKPVPHHKPKPPHHTEKPRHDPRHDRHDRHDRRPPPPPPEKKSSGWSLIFRF